MKGAKKEGKRIHSICIEKPWQFACSGFEIDRKIGKGQFSVVYRAKAVHNGMVVALKKVQIFEMMDSKARLDCMKEIQLLQVQQTRRIYTEDKANVVTAVWEKEFIQFIAALANFIHTFIHLISNKHTPLEKGFLQKTRQQSLLLFGGKNLFNSMAR